MIQAVLYLLAVVTLFVAALVPAARVPLALLGAAVFVLAHAWPVLVAAGH